MKGTENVLGVSTYTERVVEFIRDRILDGYYKPGQRLNEGELAEALNISRSPIREAIQRLAQEGLVQTASYKGATVASFDRATIIQLFELREAIEGMAAHLAAKRATDQHIAEMESLLSSTGRQLEEASGGAYPLDYDFHNVLFAMAANERLEEKAVEVTAQIRLARSLSGSYPERAARALDEHYQIFEAIRSGKPEEAERLMRAHIRTSMTHTLEILDMTEPDA